MKKMANKILSFAVPVLFVALCCTASIQIAPKHAAADVGPAPIYPQGGSLHSTAASTNVSMESERVTLTYGKATEKTNSTASGGNTEMYMPVHVKAVFKMKNTGTTTEKMSVFFPLSDNLFVGGYSEEGDNITNFKVNDKILTSSSIKNIPTMINDKTQSMPVYEWEETFQGQNTSYINIEYDAKSAKDMGIYYLTYVLGTGRGWKGPIGTADVEFVMPQAITSDMVINEAPLIEKNTIPYKVSGNSILVHLTNYEPDSDAVIALAIYDLGEMDAINQLKKQPANFTNTLKIAGGYRSLSQGPHCVFCTGPAGQQANNYYLEALNKATSKDQLNEVLKSYAYGNSTYPTDTVENLLAYFALATDKDCDLTTYECKTQAKSDILNNMRWVPFTYSDKSTYKEFLVKYSCKIRAYDRNISTTVDNFLGETSDCTGGKKTTNTTTSTKKDDKKKIILISSGATVVVLVILITLLLVTKKKRAPSQDVTAPAAKAPRIPKDKTEDNEHENPKTTPKE